MCFAADVQGFDPVFGARPVKRAIQRELQTSLAQALLRGEFVEGDTILVEAAADGLSLTLVKAKAAAAAAAGASGGSKVKVLENGVSSNSSRANGIAAAPAGEKKVVVNGLPPAGEGPSPGDH